nr:DUF6588 family protein [uncultured Carboxylicivirga sp.]
MKKNLIYSTLALLLFSGIANAQKNFPLDILKAGTHDANLIAQEYLRPYGEMLGVNLNSGWYNSAKVHKIGGFDITISGTYTTAPDSKKSFDLTALALRELYEINGKEMAPTMAGDKNQSVLFGLQSEQQVGTEYTQIELQGSDLGTFITPMVQGAVGLPFHTEIMGRFMPRVEYGDYGQAYMWGLGVKHSLKEHIPFVKRLPFIELSALGAYTHFESKLGMTGTVGSGNFETLSNAYTGRILIGANLPIVAFYSGIGYGNTRSNFDLKGEFTVGSGGNQTNDSNPISMEFVSGNFDFNVGMRIRLAIFSLHADYSVGEYSVITGGVGVNFR